MGRRLENLLDLGDSVALLQFFDREADFFAGYRSGNEHDLAVDAGDRLALEGQYLR